MSRTLSVGRHSEIMRRIERSGSVVVSDLADVFNVSRETIRRDLKVLADQGRVDIVHGGAVRPGLAEPPLSQRQSSNAAGKSAIAREAARLVSDGMTVLLDSGTTTGAVARALADKQNLTIVTNSLGHAALLCQVKTFKVFVLGGAIDPTDEAAFGIDTLAQISHFHTDVSFVACGGLAEDGTPTDYTREAAEFRTQLLARARRSYLVVDSDKFARPTPLQIGNLTKVSGVIVDRPPPQAMVEGLRDMGVVLIVAG
jgi:DeoR family transcriptional regulator, glycerol-3-phosphate regulon repressor